MISYALFLSLCNIELQIYQNSMNRQASCSIIFFILLLSAQKADVIDAVAYQNLFIVAQANTNQNQQKTLSKYLQHPRLAQQSFWIPISHLTQQISSITNYLATKSVYPNAKVPQIIPQIIKSQQSQRQFVADKIQIDNSQKQIAWKVSSVVPLLNYVLSDGIQTPLVKAQTIEQTGQAILATQGPTENPLIQNIPDTTVNQKQENERLTRVQQEQQGYDFQPSKRSRPISSFKTSNTASPGSPDGMSDSQQRSKTIQQLQTLLDKSHRWSVILVVLLIALIFFIFLFIRSQRPKKASLWSENRPKLDRYRNSIAIEQIQQQDIDFSQVQNVNINDQFEDD